MFNCFYRIVTYHTSICLKALSHSFCPGADTVQMLISWLMLSVTALEHHTNINIKS